MRKKTSLTLGELDTKLNGYVALLNYRYMNLVVKAEAVSLLPITVSYGGDEFCIEEVADVAQPSETQLIIYPKDQDLLFSIGKGIATTHPEYEQEIVDDYEEDEGEQSDEETETEKERHILLTAPKVDKDRRDILMEGVKIIYDELKVKVETNNAFYVKKITTSLASASPEEVEEAKNALDGIVNQYSDMAKVYREEKEKEIEEAYQLYLEGQEEKQQHRQEENEAENEESKTSIDLSRISE